MEPQVIRGPYKLVYVCVFYFQEPYQVLTVKMGEKSPNASSKRVRKKNPLTIPEHSVLFRKVYPQEKLV